MMNIFELSVFKMPPRQILDFDRICNIDIASIT